MSFLEAPTAVLDVFLFGARNFARNSSKYFKIKPGRLFNGDDVVAVLSPMFRTNADSLSVSSLISVAFADFFAAACLYRDWTIRDIIFRKKSKYSVEKEKRLNETAVFFSGMVAELVFTVKIQ